jgi:hypothetical protein
MWRRMQVVSKALVESTAGNFSPNVFPPVTLQNTSIGRKCTQSCMPSSSGTKNGLGGMCASRATTKLLSVLLTNDRFMAMQFCPSKQFSLSLPCSTSNCPHSGYLRERTSSQTQPQDMTLRSLLTLVFRSRPYACVLPLQGPRPCARSCTPS